MDRQEEILNELKRILQTVDGRDFVYNFFLTSCGVDFSQGIPTTKVDDYCAGARKPAIDILNMMIYHCHKEFEQMLSEQNIRRNSNG